MIVVVEGSDLPGRSCHPDSDGQTYQNIHVGLCTKVSKRTPVTPVPGRPWGVVGMVAGDAPSARWEVDVQVKSADDGLDFFGPYVRGARGDRHVGLTWGTVAEDGTFTVFRGAKLKLETIDPAVVRRADQPGWALVARLGLTDDKGNPRCATVKPPVLSWSVERSG